MRSTYTFADRHIGPRPEDIQRMLATLGFSSLEELVDRALPASIRPSQWPELDSIGPPRTESQVLEELTELARQNKVLRSHIGMGYHDCITPPVIQRNILEDPRWYTPYTPYQSEISQGRLEALLNFQTMVADLTGLQIANASLLDEATAAAEAMAMCLHMARNGSRLFLVSSGCHPQTIAVVCARAEALGIETLVSEPETFPWEQSPFGALIQTPATDGTLVDAKPLIARAHEAGALAVVACDILGLALMCPPGELGADIAVGSAQRFGVPMAFGGPHAAFLAARDSAKRLIPGRIVGVSRDAEGRPAVRLALQTREQHIRRERATSNICTAQVLLAVMASMYAVHHGPEGIREIARRVHGTARALAGGLADLGYQAGERPFFDTVRVGVGEGRAREVARRALAVGRNLRVLDESTLCIAVDETTSETDVAELLAVFAEASGRPVPSIAVAPAELPAAFARTSPILTHPVFSQHRSETEMLRYLNRLQGRDISLAESMIPLGSCTMKLNATAEMMPVTWPEFSRLHPFAPLDQVQGYLHLFRRLEQWLADITGFAAVSLQPNAGSQGEYAGLRVIRRFHRERGEGTRDVCLIPQSAHGTNPASAAMAGLRIVVVRTDPHGNIDVEDLRAKAAEHAESLAALMVTYPSTHGVFEEGIREICDIIHAHGGQVYMDGANMNALVGLCRPGDFGADVCHLNLHKTFAIPHGGGGPGMGPIAVHAHLAPFLPTHPVVTVGGPKAVGPVSAAPWGSPGVLPISYAYIAMMGPEGLRRASQVAILSANYVARRLEPHYPVLYRGTGGLVAHECIVDLRPLKHAAGVEVEDVAKRLMDYGFHAPTVSFPVPGTLMIEPTESEPLQELDEFCEAMIAIRREIQEIADGRMDRADNPLKNAPHTAEQIAREPWTHPYSREQAAFPSARTRRWKYWPPVARVDNVYGDRNLVCTCPPPGAC